MQLVPFPSNPGIHLQTGEPFRLIHVAFFWHVRLVVWHTSISAKEEKHDNKKICTTETKHSLPNWVNLHTNVSKMQYSGVSMYTKAQRNDVKIQTLRSGNGTGQETWSLYRSMFFSPHLHIYVPCLISTSISTSASDYLCIYLPTYIPIYIYLSPCIPMCICLFAY